MNRLATTHAIFLASMLFASSAFAAGSEIKKCVTESGHVTLTDEACPSGSQTVKIITAPAVAAAETDVVAAPRAVVAERYTVARMPTRYATLMKSAKPARGLALDVSTLRAARATLQQFDDATQSLRSQRIAGLQ
jgi:hypothetical protein